MTTDLAVSSTGSLPEFVQVVSTLIFGLAILHTFCVSRITALGNKYPEGSIPENLFHLLGEVEVVFGLWAGLFVGFLAVATSPQEAVNYLESRNFTEPLFVFVIMTVCATKPILDSAGVLMGGLARGVTNVFRLAGASVSKDMAEFVVIMIVGPLMGSLITEPAAMTVCALMLLTKFFSRTDDVGFKYSMLGLLFVNISIGGTLTSFAAPPVLMVAQAWKWDSSFMLQNFGWKAALACIVSTLIVAFRYRASIAGLKSEATSKSDRVPPAWLTAVHFAFVGLIVLTAHYPAVFVGAYLFFIGVTVVTKEYQTPLKLNEGLLVGFFLGGIVVLGGQQGWWLEPVLGKLTSLPLFLGAAGLTAFTDNAALTYLGSLVPNLSDASKYALVAGAVTGGGLTVIANAPNPAGYGILNGSFGENGISPGKLFVSACVPTVIAAMAYWFL